MASKWWILAQTRIAWQTTISCVEISRVNIHEERTRSSSPPSTWFAAAAAVARPRKISPFDAPEMGRQRKGRGLVGKESPRGKAGSNTTGTRQCPSSSAQARRMGYGNIACIKQLQQETGPHLCLWMNAKMHSTGPKELKCSDGIMRPQGVPPPPGGRGRAVQGRNARLAGFGTTTTQKNSVVEMSKNKQKKEINPIKWC